MGGINEKPRQGVLKWKTPVTCLFKGNHSMGSKIIECGISLLHKNKGSADRSNL